MKQYSQKTNRKQAEGLLQGCEKDIHNQVEWKQSTRLGHVPWEGTQKKRKSHGRHSLWGVSWSSHRLSIPALGSHARGGKLPELVRDCWGR